MSIDRNELVYDLVEYAKICAHLAADALTLSEEIAVADPECCLYLDIDGWESLTLRRASIRVQDDIIGEYQGIIYEEMVKRSKRMTEELRKKMEEKT